MGDIFKQLGNTLNGLGDIAAQIRGQVQQDYSALQGAVAVRSSNGPLPTGSNPVPSMSAPPALAPTSSSSSNALAYAAIGFMLYKLLK